MNIIVKMESVEKNFNELKDYAIQLNNEIKSIQDQANTEIQNRNQKLQEINNEMNRVQGEHRILVELGKEQGVLNEDGAPIQQDAEKPKE